MTNAAIYFPFIDFIVADPYKDIAETLKTAFVVGQSNVVGGTLTDMVAIASDTVQAEIWIGASDHLPRMIRAVFPQEPGNKRYETDFSNWQLNSAVAPNDFASSRAEKAPHVPFGVQMPSPRSRSQGDSMISEISRRRRASCRGHADPAGERVVSRRGMGALRRPLGRGRRTR